MDVIGLYQSGIENVAASLGTALTENQARLIKRYTRDVILSYDADSAGRAAALRGLEILKKEDCKVKVLHVTDGKDPDEYIKKNGKSAFLKLIDGALPYGDYRLESLKAGFDLDRDEDKIDYIRKATREVLSQLSPVEQDIYTKKLAKELKIAESAIKMELLGNDSTEKTHFVQRKEETEELAPDISPVEKTLLRVMLTEESYIERLQQFPEILESDFSRKMYQLLLEEYRQFRRVDINKLLDGLPRADGDRLSEIMDHVIVGGNEEKVFDDCVRTWKQNRLAKEEQRLITLLSMADEEDNQERIRQLTEELMKIQRERKQNQNQ